MFEKLVIICAVFVLGLDKANSLECYSCMTGQFSDQRANQALLTCPGYFNDTTPKEMKRTCSSSEDACVIYESTLNNLVLQFRNCATSSFCNSSVNYSYCKTCTTNLCNSGIVSAPLLPVIAVLSASILLISSRK